MLHGDPLYVSDTGNHRILGWDGWPTQTGQAADFVIGQSLFTTSAANSGGRSRTSLHTPQGLACDDGRLAVADTGNNRVLVWNTAPDGPADPADVVLGQADGGAGGANGAGGADQGGLNGPTSVLLMPNGGGTAVLVADYNSHRVVQWDSLPGSDGAAFDRVYGQPDRATTALNSGGAAGPNTLGGPGHLTREQGSDRFWVSENVNSRLTVWKLGDAASVGLYGQRTASNRGLFHGSSGATRVPWSRTSSLLLSLDPQSGLTSLTGCGGRLWRTPPTDGSTPFAAVQGSPDFGHCDGSSVVSPVSQMGPFSAVRVGTRVYWTDRNRILSRNGDLSGANSIPDLVLGHVDFNANIVTANTYLYRIDPSQLATDGTRLYAVDGPRIVGWDTAPTTSNPPIDFALGQATLLTRNANDGGVSASSLSADVRSILVAGGKLFAVDTGNHRVLIWNTLPNTTGAPADVVLGQPNGLSSAAGSGLDGMSAPTGVALSGGKLLVSDRGNRRVLVWDAVPTQDGVSADRVWYPADFTFSLPSWFYVAGSWSGAPIWAPERIHAYEGKLYLNYMDRVLVLPDIF